MQTPEGQEAMLCGIIPDAGNVRIVLVGRRQVVGRKGDIVLHHESVSREHAALEFRDGEWQIADLDSRNGTFVNNICVQRRHLNDGDVVRFGRVRLKFSVIGAKERDEADESETRTMALTTTTFSLENTASLSLVGRSEPLRGAMKLAVRAAKSDATVLLFGESGTGKELFARLIYEESNRRKRKYLAVNCSAIEQTLLSSTLFGHEKGAFTGADKQKLGLFEEADGGTLFLDEIGELSQDMQVKLLRVLQEGEFMRVGGTEPVKVDVRVLTATNKDLARLVAEGKFREDLYYRLNVIQITLPPLRDRPGDVEDLVRHFVSEIGGPTRSISSEAMSVLSAYSWPGNVRQLRNVMERTIILSQNDELQPEDFPPEIRATRSPTGEGVVATQSGHVGAYPRTDNLADVEGAHIRATLEACGGNKKLAAERLGISRSTLYEKLKECPIFGRDCLDTGQTGP